MTLVWFEREINSDIVAGNIAENNRKSRLHANFLSSYVGNPFSSIFLGTMYTHKLCDSFIPSVAGREFFQINFAAVYFTGGWSKGLERNSATFNPPAGSLN